MHLDHVFIYETSARIIAFKHGVSTVFTCFDLAIWSTIEIRKKIMRPKMKAFHKFPMEKMLPEPGSRESRENLPSDSDSAREEESMGEAEDT